MARPSKVRKAKVGYNKKGGNSMNEDMKISEEGRKEIIKKMKDRLNNR